MKPAPFRYFDPASVDDALSLLAKCGDEARTPGWRSDARPYAQPASCLATNSDRRQPNYSARLPSAELRRNYYRSTDPPSDIGGQFHVRFQAALRCDRHTVHCPSRNPQPRNGWRQSRACRSGRRVGRLSAGAQREPDFAQTRRRRRVIAAKDFFLGLLTTAIEPDEMLIQISLPAWPAGAGWSFLEFSRRHGDYAIAGIACVLSLGPDVVDEVKLAAFGVEETPRRLAAAEGVLRGEPLALRSPKRRHAAPLMTCNRWMTGKALRIIAGNS